MMDEDWKDSKKELPPLGEVIEGAAPKGWFYSHLCRHYFALVEVNSKLTWISPTRNNFEYNELEISHWRHIPPNPNGKKPFVKIIKRKGFWESKVVFKRFENA